MDKRINSNAAHGMEVYKMASAGASFPPPPPEQQHSTFEDSLHVLLERTQQTGMNVIAGFSGHSDCVAVKSIWDIGEKPTDTRLAREAARLARYGNLVAQLRAYPALAHDDALEVLTQAKVLQDVNYAHAYEDIQAVVGQRLRIVAYYEDVTVSPHTLLIYDPIQNQFVQTQDHRLKELSQTPALLEHFALDKPVDVAAFIREAVADKARPHVTHDMPKTRPLRAG